MEKTLDNFTGGAHQQIRPLRKYQFVYQSGKFTTKAMHELTSNIDGAIEAKQMSFAVLIDIQGAFYNT